MSAKGLGPREAARLSSGEKTWVSLKGNAKAGTLSPAAA